MQRLDSRVCFSNPQIGASLSRRLDFGASVSVFVPRCDGTIPPCRLNCFKLCIYTVVISSLSVKFACRGSYCVVRILSSIARQSGTELSQFHFSGISGPRCLDPSSASSPFRLGAASGLLYLAHADEKPTGRQRYVALM